MRYGALAGAPCSGSSSARATGHASCRASVRVRVGRLRRTSALPVRGVSRRGIAARTGQHAVGESLLAGLGERDERGGAESEFAAPTADDEPLDPASDPGRLDEQVQAVAVRVASGRCGTDEGGREGLVGVASSALGSAGRGNGFGYNIQSPIICGIGLDSATCPDRTSPRRRIINYYVSVICGLDRMTSDAGGLPLGIRAGRTRTGCSRCSGAARASTAGSSRWSRPDRYLPRCTGGRRPRS